jgi:hypothetical protein
MDTVIAYSFTDNGQTHNVVVSYSAEDDFYYRTVAGETTRAWKAQRLANTQNYPLLPEMHPSTKAIIEHARNLYPSLPA